MGLGAQAIDRINARVYREYPELRGARPSITAQGSRFVLTYRGKASTESGAVLARIVRVTADENGEVSRISTSK